MANKQLKSAGGAGVMATADLDEEGYVGIFASESAPAELKEYLRTHRIRMLATAAAAPVRSGDRVVDIGSSPPHELCVLLWLREPSCRFSAVLHPASGVEPGLADAVRPPGTETLVIPPVRRYLADAERDRLPMADQTADLVIFTEVLEHLLINPLNVAREAARILRPGGHLLMTTPNVTSFASVGRVIEGLNPASFSSYSPYGPYGRHNREYTPAEVEALAQAAGFNTVALSTFDPQPSPPAAKLGRHVLHELDRFVEHRGQTVLYLGVRHRYDPLSWPPSLYHADPNVYRGHIASSGLVYQPSSQQIDMRLFVTNDGQQPWDAINGVVVRVRVVDCHGVIRVPSLAELPLVSQPQPGETVLVEGSVPVIDLGVDLTAILDLAPVGMLSFGELCALNLPLLVDLPRRRAGPVARPQPQQLVVRRSRAVEITDPLTVDLTADGPNLARCEGLGNPETWGTWTVGPRATLFLPVPLPAALTLTITGRAFGPNVGKPVTVTVGKAIAHVVLGEHEEATTVVLAGTGKPTAVTFDVPLPTTPASVGMGHDHRPLGLGLTRLVFARRS